MKEYVLFIATIILIYFLHEIGHYLVGKFLNLNLRGITYSKHPFPHFYVAVDWPKSQLKKHLFLFAGFTTTLLLYFFFLNTSYSSIKSITSAFIFQLILESNPFYSDFSIALFTRNVNSFNAGSVSYVTLAKEHLFSTLWYVHFISWGCLIYYLINYQL